MAHKGRLAQLSPQDGAEMRCQIAVASFKSRSKRSRRGIPSGLHSGLLCRALFLLTLISVCYTSLFWRYSDHIHRFAAVLVDLGSLPEQVSSLLADMATPRTLYYWLAKASLLGFSLAATDKATYTDHSVTAIKTLQTFYDEPDGLWETTGWWNSANCLTVLGDFLSLAVGGADDLDLDSVLSNTFTQAQQTTQTATKTLVKGLSRRLFESRYTASPVLGDSGLAARGFSGFINNYYDDEGWWALAWVRAYDVTGNTEYLDMAESIFADMQGGVNGTCGGGIWWSKDRKYKNASKQLSETDSVLISLPYLQPPLSTYSGLWQALSRDRKSLLAESVPLHWFSRLGIFKCSFADFLSCSRQ